MKKMIKILLALFFVLTVSNCGGGGAMTAPDPKRISCEQSCGAVAEKAVKKCTSEKKSEAVCKTAGSAAESKCIDECMAQ